MTAPRLLARRAGAALCVWAAVLAAVSSVLLAGCTASAAESAPSLTAIAKVLDQHGGAVRNHNRAAFLDGVSTGPASAAFRHRQQAQFAALRSVPLSAWSYRVAGRTDDRSAERAASKRYGAPATVVRLTLRYALAGVDPRPSEHDLWWTFVRRDGAVVAAGDDDLAGVGGTSWKGPWDFGPLVVERAPDVVVLAHPGAAAAARSIAQVTSAAVPAVTAVWGTDWARRVAVLVPSSTAELSADAGQNSTEPTSVAAVAVSDGPAASPGAKGASGSVTGQRLVVDPAGFARLSALGRTVVVRHEVTHVASAGATGDLTPRWLVEGFADYVGNLGTGQPARVVASELAAAVRRGRVPSALPGDGEFDDSSTAAGAYEQSWLACRLIAQRAGQAGLVRLYRLVGSSPSTDPVTGALRSVLHESLAAFTAQWRVYVREQLR